MISKNNKDKQRQQLFYNLIYKMNKLTFLKFKKQLEESSHAIFDSKLSTSNNHKCNDQQNYQKHNTGQFQIANKLDSTKAKINNISIDYNKLIKTIPQLLSENDELREKVRKLEVQFNHIIQCQSNREVQYERFKYKQPFKMLPSPRRVSKIQNYDYQRSNYNSYDEHTISGNMIQEYKYYKNQIKCLQQGLIQKQKIIDEINKKNKYLQEQNRRYRQQKMKSKDQIDKISIKFQQTLRQKDKALNEQINYYQQKILKLKKQIEQNNKERMILNQQNIKLKLQISQYMHFDHNRDRFQLKYNFDNVIDHLWKIKEVQFKNISNIINNISSL